MAQGFGNANEFIWAKMCQKWGGFGLQLDMDCKYSWFGDWGHSCVPIPSVPRHGDMHCMLIMRYIDIINTPSKWQVSKSRLLWGGFGLQLDMDCKYYWFGDWGHSCVPIPSVPRHGDMHCMLIMRYIDIINTPSKWQVSKSRLLWGGFGLQLDMDCKYSWFGDWGHSCVPIPSVPRHGDMHCMLIMRYIDIINTPSKWQVSKSRLLWGGFGLQLDMDCKYSWFGDWGHSCVPIPSVPRHGDMHCMLIMRYIDIINTPSKWQVSKSRLLWGGFGLQLDMDCKYSWFGDWGHSCVPIPSVPRHGDMHCMLIMSWLVRLRSPSSASSRRCSGVPHER
jgi:hypothetical protein